MSALHSTSARFKTLTDLADRPRPTSDDEEKLRTLRAVELVRCAADPVYWFNTWVWTYNPKLVGLSSPWLPMNLFPRQEELVRWLRARSAAKEDGLCEKSRDIGFTWLSGGNALHRWLFESGYKCNFGSRKAEYVDRNGDPDSIFEKIRMIYRMLPYWMMPSHFNPRENDKSMLLENPDTGSIIRGESGDDMGRGGRSTDYVFDEFAFVERADKVDAASVANSDCRIFGSTVNGQGNLFYRKRHDGSMREDQIFRFHYTHDPRKTPAWAATTRAKMEPHKWASEYDIDYSASVEGICIPATWVTAAKLLALHAKPPEPPRKGVAGGDVGGGGRAKSVVVARFGPIVLVPEAWGDGDTINTANRMVDYCAKVKPTAKRKDGHECAVATLYYDQIGVGKGVQDALKRRSSPGLIKHGVNVGDEASDRTWPDGETSKEKFANLKAEAHWVLRERFKCSYEMFLHLTDPANKEAQKHDLADCIFLPPDSAGPEAMKLASQLSVVKWESNEKGKIAIQSKKSLAKDGIPSPDHADALVLTEAGTSKVDTWMKAFAS